jgi:hypothetical protein
VRKMFSDCASSRGRTPTKVEEFTDEFDGRLVSDVDRLDKREYKVCQELS